MFKTLLQSCLFLSLLVCSTLGYSQERYSISGKLSDQAGAPLTDAYIYLEHTQIYTMTNQAGEFKLSAPVGTYQLVCSLMGYEKKTISIELHNDLNVAYKLGPDREMQLDEVQIKGKSVIEKVRESAYNVVAVDAQAMTNTTADLSNALEQASGVKVRRSGGLGSRASISLNGFTGRRVKLFMDGVPMEGFGDAFQLNNIPVSIADRIEVYKGVVPIEFGTDAMGGVINIVTNQSSNTFVDASYAFGSFNTHRASVSTGFTSKNGFSVLVNGFLNYSDNNYKVHLDKMLDVNTGTYVAGDYEVERFHDTYQNKTVMVKAGFVKKWWADRFFVGLTVGELEADVQNAYTMEIVYGARTRASKTLLPSLEYYKRNFLTKNLTARVTANYNHNANKSIDTVARLYNWYGDYATTRTRGESGTNTLSEFKDNNVSATANLSYDINKKHSIKLNDVITGYERKLSSDVSLDQLTSATDTMRRASRKNVIGLSYGYRPSKKWNVNFFGKHYYQYVVGPVDTVTVGNNSQYEEQERSFQTSGYGLAATYFFNNPIQLKASAERAYNLPSAQQLFGDEVLNTANTSLKAENSSNFNLGVSSNSRLKNDDVLYVDVNGYYRLTKDFIQRVQSARYGTVGNVNFGRVRNIGADAEVRYYHKNKVMVGGTLTYMDLRNREQIRDASSSVASSTYNNRMPNIPYFFGNADAAYYVHDIFGKNNVLSLNYNFNYVGEFYLLWESQGSSSTKATLPEQVYHDFSVNLSLAKGTYNITLEALNFTDARLYDNFSLQKPGRAFNVKFRYYWNRRK